MASAYADALRMLARRELPVEGVRARLLDREHPPEAVETAITQLIETGALNDERFAKAYARTAATVKKRGRLRVLRELTMLGVARETAAQAVGEVFGEMDERTLIARAIQKKLHGRPKPKDAQERLRLYQFLTRQGFTPAAIAAALRRAGASRDED